jgi:hypothetical protein
MKKYKQIQFNTISFNQDSRMTDEIFLIISRMLDDSLSSMQRIKVSKLFLNEINFESKITNGIKTYEEL